MYHMITSMPPHTHSYPIHHTIIHKKQRSRHSATRYATHLLQFGLHPAGLEAEELGSNLLGGIASTADATSSGAPKASPGQHGEQIGVHLDWLEWCLVYYM